MTMSTWRNLNIIIFEDVYFSTHIMSAKSWNAAKFLSSEENRGQQWEQYGLKCASYNEYFILNSHYHHIIKEH